MKKILLTIFFCLPHSCLADLSSIETALKYPRIGNIAVSPDGKQLAYTTSQIVTIPNGKQRDYFLYMRDTAGHATQLLKSEHVSDPAWSPDGKLLAYLNKNGKQQEIKIYNQQSKQTSTLVALTERNISAFKWSPNGKFIAYVAENEKQKSHSLLTPIDVDQSLQNARIYLIALNSTSSLPLTSDQISISQAFSANLDSGFDWSPDSHAIAYAYQLNASANESIHSKIAILHLNTHKITDIPYMQDHAGSQPLYSPDGEWIAFRSNLTSTENSNLVFYSDPELNSQICVTHLSDLATHCLASTYNENPFIIGWSASSRSLYALDWYKAAGPQIYELNLDANHPVKTISTADGFIQPLTLTLNASHRYFAFGYETPTQAPEIYLADVDSFKSVQVTHIQDTSSATLGHSEVIHWVSKDNLPLEGILITPANFNSKKKYPLLVDIHGGPAGAWAERYVGGCDEYGDMILPVCTQALLDQGFVVFRPNYRGSSGYGKIFRAANVRDLGGEDYKDIMAGVDSLIRQGVADPNHLAVFGWSYGGYLTAWMITQTHRFKAAVEGSGLTDLLSFAGTSDITYFLQYYLDNALWENSKLYLERSPILYTKNVTTPLLILHGADDKRVPLSQSYEFYTALKTQDKTVRMLINPEQGHVLTDGNIIYQNLLATNEWLEKALQ